MNVLHLIRNRFEVDRTLGTLITPYGEFDTLEDAVRPEGVKVPDVTAIPAGVYTLSQRFSPSFDRDMLMITSEMGESYVRNGGQSFSYIYFHGGTRPEHTSGCILLPEMNSEMIWERMSRYRGLPLVITNDFEGMTV